MNRPLLATPPLILLILCFAAYCLPWVINPGISLSLGAYDLAEWTSLHPAVRAASPALLTTLLLRLPLACLGLLISLTSKPHSRSLPFALTMLVSIALLPPLEFFTQAANDPNYQQQFILSMLTALVGILLVMVRLEYTRNLLMIALALIALTSSVAGVLQSHELMRSFSLSAQLGLGSYVFGGLLAAVVLLAAASTIPHLKQTR
jgi:hypothetical protein